MNTLPENSKIYDWSRTAIKIAEYHPNVTIAFRAATRHVANCLEKVEPGILTITGDPGTGKTHIAKVCRELVKGAPDDFLMKWGRPPTTGFIRWLGVSVREEWASLDDAVPVEFLVIDDIGANPDKWGKDMARLALLLDEREGRNLWTLITTNVRAEHWVERFGERVESRMTRNGGRYFEMTGVKQYQGI